MKPNPKILKYDITFDWKEMKFKGLTLQQLELWDALYKLPSFELISGDMTRWLDKKRNVPSVSQKKNWRKFIANWLERERQKEQFSNARG
jgi:hypothetical protein